MQALLHETLDVMNSERNVAAAGLASSAKLLAVVFAIVMFGGLTVTSLIAFAVGNSPLGWFALMFVGAGLVGVVLIVCAAGLPFVLATRRARRFGSHPATTGYLPVELEHIVSEPRRGGFPRIAVLIASPAGLSLRSGSSPDIEWWQRPWHDLGPLQVGNSKQTDFGSGVLVRDVAGRALWGMGLRSRGADGLLPATDASAAESVRVLESSRSRSSDES